MLQLYTKYQDAFKAFGSFIFFLLVVLFGEGFFAGLGSNLLCFQYIGCTNGFGGYDAFEHFIFGISIIWILVWFFKTYPKYSLLQNNIWKDVLILIMSAIFIFVIWEFIECAYDVFRVDVLDQPLINFKLHINFLAQPSNLDTIGDLALGLLGSLIGLFTISKK